MIPYDYGITVRRVTEEGEALFEARVRELPDVAEYADTFEEAYQLAIDTIETTAEALAEQGRPMPSPQPPADDFSGRITLRVPRTLHRALSLMAEDEGISLNQHIVAVLSYYVGVCTPTRRPTDWREGPPREVEGHAVPGYHGQPRIVHRVDPIAGADEGWRSLA